MNITFDTYSIRYMQYIPYIYTYVLNVRYGDWLARIMKPTFSAQFVLVIWKFAFEYILHGTHFESVIKMFSLYHFRFCSNNSNFLRFFLVLSFVY